MGSIALPVGDRVVITNQERRKFFDLLFYSIGIIFAAAVLGAFLGLLGTWLPITPLWQIGKVALLGILCLLYALHELQIVTLPTPQRKQQVPEKWRYTLPRSLTALFFGLLLGLGYITFIIVGTFYIVTIGAVFFGTPLLGAILFGLFGLGRASSMWLLSSSMKSLEQVEYTIARMTMTTALVHLANGIALALAGGVILSKLWLGL